MKELFKMPILWLVFILGIIIGITINYIYIQAVASVGCSTLECCGEPIQCCCSIKI
jgi:hypothetical protein